MVNHTYTITTLRSKVFFRKSYRNVLILLFKLVNIMYSLSSPPIGQPDSAVSILSIHSITFQSFNKFLVINELY